VVDICTEMKFATEQRRNFCKEEAYTKCICKLCRKYPDSPVPTKFCVSKFLKKWRDIGSVCGIKKQLK
jgi:hypothetical protein